MFTGASAACTRWNRVGIFPASFRVGITRANFSGCEFIVMTEQNLYSSCLDDLWHQGVGSGKHLFQLDLACMCRFGGNGGLRGRMGLKVVQGNLTRITPMPWNCNPVVDLQAEHIAAIFE